MTQKKPPSTTAQIATMCFTFVTSLAVAMIGFTLTGMAGDMREMRGELRDHLKFHLEHPMPDQSHAVPDMRPLADLCPTCP